MVHLGEGEWIVVDSCREAKSRRPYALVYLESIGVDPSTQVKHVISTHYHDDHVGGLSELFGACKAATYTCSLALRSEDWETLAELYRGYINPAGTGIDEYALVLKEIEARLPAGAIATPNYCMTGVPIFTRGGALPAVLRCLAPSHAAIGVMQTKIREELLPKQSRRRRRVPQLDSNDGSVVLSVQVGVVKVLLGGDLEDHGTPGLGWQVLLDEHSIPHPGFAGFKVPHHGSANGHHPLQWSGLMKQDSWAALTPYNRGKKKLPQKSDCSRILGLTSEAYITAPHTLPRAVHPNSAVLKEMQSVAQEIGVEGKTQGQVQFRRDALGANPWTIQLFGSAMALKDF